MIGPLTDAQVSFWAQNPSGAVNSALYATFGSSLQPVNLAQDWTFCAFEPCSHGIG